MYIRSRMKQYQLKIPDESYPHRVFGVRVSDTEALSELNATFPEAMNGMYLAEDDWVIKDVSGPRILPILDHTFRRFYKEVAPDA